MPGGKYRYIIVPECKYIPLQTFKQLFALAERGATVVFVNDLPKDISGAKDTAKNQVEFNQLKSKLIFQDGLESASKFLKIAKVGKGRIEYQNYFFGGSSFADTGLSFVCRSFDDGWNYFIANRTETNFDGWVSLDHLGQTSSLLHELVLILDPMTGNFGVAAQNQLEEIHLQLAAGETRIIRTFRHKKIEGPAWNYWQPNGQPVAISGDWKIKFLAGGPVLPTDFQTTKLASWTTFPDTNTQAFAGTAKYETTFDVPDAAGKTFEINLGEVRQSARVRVNGKDYGTLITPPFRVVVDNLKPTGNTLEVEVTSVAANRIRDLDRRGVNWKIFKDINIVNENYRPFNAANWPLTDCGLLGPVTLTPVTDQK
jgi:hypothetical protein